MILNKFLDSLEKQWLAVVIAALWLFSYTVSQEKNASLINQTKELETKVIDLEKKDDEYAKTIDSLSKIDTVIVNGQVVWCDGAATGQRPGRVLQRDLS